MMFGAMVKLILQRMADGATHPTKYRQRGAQVGNTNVIALGGMIPIEWDRGLLDQPSKKGRMSYLVDHDAEHEARYRAQVKPCPFCGTPPTIWSSGEGGKGLMIHCVTENCANPSVSYYDHKVSLAVWNRRAKQP